MGSPAPGADGMFFAYGGAGFVLSRGLMESMLGDSTQLSVRYQESAMNDCCGDAVLAYAIMNETGRRLEALYPTFAGDELIGLRVDHERFCVPLLALHRVSPEQMESLWAWERTRPYDEVRRLWALCSSVHQPLTFYHSLRSHTRLSWTTSCLTFRRILRGSRGTTGPRPFSRKTHPHTHPPRNVARAVWLTLAACSIHTLRGPASLDFSCRRGELRQTLISRLAGTWRRYTGWDMRKTRRRAVLALSRPG